MLPDSFRVGCIDANFGQGEYEHEVMKQSNNNTTTYIICISAAFHGVRKLEFMASGYMDFFTDTIWLDVANNRQQTHQ